MANYREADVSPSLHERLQGTVEHIRDSGLVVIGKAEDSDWHHMWIEWRGPEARAELTNLGNGCIYLALHSRTISSNGVTGVSDFNVGLRPDTSDNPSTALEYWTAKWTLPVPGSSSGHRLGDEAVEQLDSEIDRFLNPITNDSVIVVTT